MILDITSFSETFIRDIEKKVQKRVNPLTLVIVLVGDNSASELYVRRKIIKCQEVWIVSRLIRFPSSITERELLDEIVRLNNDVGVHAILVQAPLPAHISSLHVFDALSPYKDVDGFSSVNKAQLYNGILSWLVPGTPLGVLKIIQNYRTIQWTHVVIIWKSTIVGKPMLHMLIEKGATVTLCHSKTRDLASHTRQADIIVAAVGKKHLITADMVRPWALVIDVWISITESPIDAKKKLFGDCDTENIATIADITPVPGGVGPMTIAMLLNNVLLAWDLQWIL